MRRCERCGATNPGHARWCGQCYASLEAGGAGEAGGPGHAVAHAGPARAAVPGGQAAGQAGTGAAFRQRDGEVEWACAACGIYNPLAAGACAACGTALTAAFGAGAPAATEAGPGRRADPRLALAASAVLPGSGHVLSGQAATGVARAVLYAVWLGGGLLVGASGGALLVTGPLLLGALVVWAGSLVDLVNLPHGRTPLLGARALLWLVVGVTLLSLVGLAGGVAGAAAAGP